MHSERFQRLCIFCIMLSVQVLHADDFLLQIDPEKGRTPAVRSGETLLEFTSEPFFIKDPYILSNNCKNEMRLYSPAGKPEAFILLSPLTDLRISREIPRISGEIPRISLVSNFGRFRCVSNKETTFIIHAKNGVNILISPGSDIVYSCISDFSRMHNLTLAVFSGQASVYDKKSQKFLTNVEPMQLAEIDTPEYIHISEITKEMLKYFRETNSRRDGVLEKEPGICPVLEGKPQEIKKYSQDDIILHPLKGNNTDDIEPLHMPQKRIKVSSNLLNFKLSCLFSINSIGGLFGWHPSVKTVDNLFELSLRFDLAFQIRFFGENSIENSPVIPEKLWLNFMQINGEHSEWFVDAVAESSSAGAAALGIIEDTLLKINQLRWGTEKTPFYFQLGTMGTRTDKNALRYSFYSPSLFLPYNRATSMDIIYQKSFFQGEFYAESIPFGGLFDTCFQFFTPLRSMKSRIEIDFGMDTYRLHQIAMGKDSTAAFPIYTDIGWSFTVFDLPSFGYEFYLNAGFIMPLTAGENNEFSMKAENLLNTMHITCGQKLRGKGPTFSIELFFQSQCVSRFTPLYSLYKEQYLTSLAENCENSNYNFGARLGLSWLPRSWVNLYAFYRPAAAFSQLFTNGDTAEDTRYSDNFFTGITLSPIKTSDIGLSLTFALEWDEPVAVLKNLFSGNNDAFYGEFAAHINTEVSFWENCGLGCNLSCVPSKDSQPIFRGEFYALFSFKHLNKKKTKQDSPEEKIRHMENMLSDDDNIKDVEEKNPDIQYIQEQTNGETDEN